MNSGGSGDWGSRGRREAIPEPISQACPVVGLTRTFAGFTSLWISPFSCNPLRAVAIPTAKRRKRAISIGPGRNRSRMSPPGSSSTSVICPWRSERATGRTAQAESSSPLSEYSFSNLLRGSSAGDVEAAASKRTDGLPPPFEHSPRYRMNSSSVRRGSVTSVERSTNVCPPDFDSE
jgi:hypothetical protein